MEQDFVRNWLFEHAEPNYREFSAKLIPGIHESMIGVRLPLLRKLTKTILAGDWRRFLSENQHQYYEETMLSAFVIGTAKMEDEERIHCVKEFLPCIQNWGVCDSFCAALPINSKNRIAYWKLVKDELEGTEEFRVRFALVMMLMYGTKEASDVLEGISHLQRVQHQGYYVKMAVAWYLAEACKCCPEEMIDYISRPEMDSDIRRKAIQKCIESKKIEEAVKTRLRSLREREIK